MHQAPLLDPSLGPTKPFLVFPPEAIEQAIPTRFEEQVRLYPHRLAIKTAHEALTYEALNALATQIAWALLDRLGSSEESVALLCAQGVIDCGQGQVTVDGGQVDGG